MKQQMVGTIYGPVLTEKISTDSRISLNDYFIFKKKDCSGHTENREDDNALET